MDTYTDSRYRYLQILFADIDNMICPRICCIDTLGNYCQWVHVVVDNIDRESVEAAN